MHRKYFFLIFCTLLTSHTTAFISTCSNSLVYLNEQEQIMLQSCGMGHFIIIKSYIIQYQNNTENLLKLLNYHDSLNQSPLHYAAQQIGTISSTSGDFVEIIELLIEKGAAINAHDVHNRTALFYIVQSKTLLDHQKKRLLLLFNSVNMLGHSSVSSTALRFQI